ncbi:hypothetical protein BpHYR1_022958 [Brachionus plicatilis]|uniref:C2H2-type domain-containing protein n=1 Tax=Brachionus plicatilis TaxID=10195 RepID=A0A3M7PUU3_BRAPC|nr:hypothetical protein BpHYR1_022958 [Brachionus plicatilis]
MGLACYVTKKFSKIASEAPIASEATQSAVKKVLSKHKNPIACPECGKLMKNERVILPGHILGDHRKDDNFYSRNSPGNHYKVDDRLIV